MSDMSPSDPLSLTRRRWFGATALAAAGLSLGCRRAAAAAPLPASAKGGIPVAVVLDKGATLIDFGGPWEVLSSCAQAGNAGFYVYSVAATRDPIVCDNGRAQFRSSLPDSGLTVVPDFTFATAPQPKIVLMGAQGGDSKEKVGWIQKAAERADLVASVCVGAFLLAETGLLDGKEATTNRNAYDQFAKAYPKVKLVRGVRLVASGNVATATGLTAGFDLSLRIVDRYYGRAAAEKIALYEEWPGTTWRSQA